MTNQIRRTQNLQKQLDEIDKKVVKAVENGLFTSKLGILVGMWEKGEVIELLKFRGVEFSNQPSYYALEKETGRTQPSLKKWHQLYLKYPDKQQYLFLAEKNAHKWTDKILEKIKEQKTLISNEPPQIEQGQYRTIIIDPPWPYGTQYDEDTRRVASPYPEMTIEAIERMELPTADNCVLWLWTTHKFLPVSFDILQSWGFDYKATLTWNKENMGLDMLCEQCYNASLEKENCNFGDDYYGIHKHTETKGIGTGILLSPESKGDIISESHEMSESLPDMPNDFRDNKKKGTILQPEMHEQVQVGTTKRQKDSVVGGRQKSSIQRQDNSTGVCLPIPAEKSNGNQARLCSGAPIANGEGNRETASSDRNSTSQKSKKERQPNRKSRIDAGQCNSFEKSLEKRKRNLSEVRVCSRCGARGEIIIPRRFGALGMGYWLRMQCEFCLLAVKGEISWPATSLRDIISEKRREHSRKPEVFYDMILDICPKPIGEAFSRQGRKGITAIVSNEPSKFKQMAG